MKKSKYGELRFAGLAVAVMAVLAACATHVAQSGAASPGDVPDSQLVVPMPTVGSLKPAFAWTGSKKSGDSFDFIICVGVQEGHGFWSPGKVAYYRQGLQTTTHTVEQALAPDTVYIWSVRTRHGNLTSKWASYSDDDPRFTRGKRRVYNLMYLFKTPGKMKI